MWGEMHQGELPARSVVVHCRVKGFEVNRSC